MKNKTNTSNIIIKLAAILFCLTLITTHFTSGLYARYISRSAADSSARVASFVVETDLDHIKLGSTGAPTLQLGGEQETQSVQLPFYISNGSEVAVGYSLSVDFGKALPEYLNVKLTNGANTQTITANGAESEFVFSDFGTLSAGSTEPQKADLMLTIFASDLSMITDEVSIPAAKLTVMVYQVD